MCVCERLCSCMSLPLSVWMWTSVDMSTITLYTYAHFKSSVNLHVRHKVSILSSHDAFFAWWFLHMQNLLNSVAAFRCHVLLFYPFRQLRRMGREKRWLVSLCFVSSMFLTLLVSWHELLWAETVRAKTVKKCCNRIIFWKVLLSPFAFLSGSVLAWTVARSDADTPAAGAGSMGGVGAYAVQRHEWLVWRHDSVTDWFQHVTTCLWLSVAGKVDLPLANSCGGVVGLY